MFLWNLYLECGYIDLSDESDNSEFGREKTGMEITG